MENIRTVRMRAPAGHCGGASVDGTNYPANADGTITVPDGRPCAELKSHGFEVVEINEPSLEG
ncbi:hypothetical protein [Rhodanobacter sp. DHB23]|uniref:hypothetical protein n=1 Tax=Rhodanobacter sp. DHB23 TaxID=2775923 RepID=UPI00177E4D81|nr:hypothetical protein [Rhodanobacter sp. DHB23]MBD8873869.1 hypothetical protein [Rhodanobacter sp. DHB23]